MSDRLFVQSSMPRRLASLRRATTSKRNRTSPPRYRQIHSASERILGERYCPGCHRHKKSALFETPESKRCASCVARMDAARRARA
jgi:hypothetical protein